VKANRLIKANIDALLQARRQTRKDLAQWCHKSESWISKIFKEERREFATSDLDRIADFFGLATYQLFQPGISPLTERRAPGDRRTHRERRVGHAHRLMLRLGSAIDPYRSRTTPTAPGEAHQLSPDVAAELLRLTKEHEQKVAAVLAAGAPEQIATPRKKLPKPPLGR